MQVMAAYYIRIGGGNIWGKFSWGALRCAPALFDVRLSKAMLDAATHFIFRRVCVPEFVISCAPL